MVRVYMTGKQLINLQDHIAINKAYNLMQYIVNSTPGVSDSKISGILAEMCQITANAASHMSNIICPLGTYKEKYNRLDAACVELVERGEDHWGQLSETFLLVNV